MELVFICCGIIIGVLICYLILKPKLNNIEIENEKIIEKNNEQQQINNMLKSVEDDLHTHIDKLKDEELIAMDRLRFVEAAYKEVQAKRQEVMESIKILKEQAENSSQAIYDTNFQLMQEKMSAAADQLSNEYQVLQDKCKDEYLLTLRDCGAELAATLALKLQEIHEAEQTLASCRAKADAAIEATKREEEKLLELDKYKINITELDLLEINRLREIAPYFRNARAIYKIIWESYYRNNTTEMINRILGSGIHSGIYRITDLTNQKIYIGQATDLATRLKEHVKAGLGIDTPNNKLYVAMIKNGVENFSFEIVEKCDRDKLNEREAHWIAFYRSQEFGYNMTKGNSH